MNIQSNIPATALRRRMIEDMVGRNLGPHSRRNHLASCTRFAAFLERSPDTATADDKAPVPALPDRERGEHLQPQPDHDRGEVPVAGDAAPA